MNGQLLTIAVLFLLATSPLIFGSDAFAQVQINVTDATPCFLNYTAGVQMWENCGMDEDYLGAVLVPFEWVTGGLFSMIVVIILIIMTYIKYHTVIYPITIGLIMLPTSWFLFPDVFLSYAILLTGLAIGGLIWYIYTQQTRNT